MRFPRTLNPSACNGGGLRSAIWTRLSQRRVLQSAVSVSVPISSAERPWDVPDAPSTSIPCVYLLGDHAARGGCQCDAIRARFDSRRGSRGRGGGGGEGAALVRVRGKMAACLARYRGALRFTKLVGNFGAIIMEIMQCSTLQIVWNFIAR